MAQRQTIQLIGEAAKRSAAASRIMLPDSFAAKGIGPLCDVLCMLPALPLLEELRKGGVPVSAECFSTAGRLERQLKGKAENRFWKVAVELLLRAAIQFDEPQVAGKMLEEIDSRQYSKLFEFLVKYFGTPRLVEAFGMLMVTHWFFAGKPCYGKARETICEVLDDYSVALQAAGTAMWIKDDKKFMEVMKVLQRILVNGILEENSAGEIKRTMLTASNLLSLIALTENSVEEKEGAEGLERLKFCKADVLSAALAMQDALDIRKCDYSPEGVEELHGILFKNYLYATR